MKSIYNIYDPAIYHGQKKKAPFFEGWYFKLITKNQLHKYAIIPGIYNGNEKYSFIQILDGNIGKTIFLKFPYDSFISNNKKFNIQIDNNIFELNKISINILQNDIKINGKLFFENVIGWP